MYYNPESEHLENTIDIIVFLSKGLSQGPISIIFKSPAAKSLIFSCESRLGKLAQYNAYKVFFKGDENEQSAL